MIIDNNKTQEKILALLLMRYKVSPKQSLEMIQTWLQKHPGVDYAILEEYLRSNLVRVENNDLVDLYEERIMTLVKDLRGNAGITIKDRRYKLTNYPLCFIGNEAVAWMETQYLLSKPEAIRLGQELIELKIIHHVTDDHDFKNDYLFYRFYIDEQ